LQIALNALPDPPPEIRAPNDFEEINARIRCRNLTELLCSFEKSLPKEPALKPDDVEGM